MKPFPASFTINDEIYQIKDFSREKVRVLARLDAAVHESLADARLRQRFSDIGQEIWPLEMQTPRALQALQWLRGGERSVARTPGQGTGLAAPDPKEPGVGGH